MCFWLPNGMEFGRKDIETTYRGARVTRMYYVRCGKADAVNSPIHFALF